MRQPAVLLGAHFIPESGIINNNNMRPQCACEGLDAQSRSLLPVITLDGCSLENATSGPLP